MNLRKTDLIISFNYTCSVFTVIHLTAFLLIDTLLSWRNRCRLHFVTENKVFKRFFILIDFMMWTVNKVFHSIWCCVKNKQRGSLPAVTAHTSSPVSCPNKIHKPDRSSPHYNIIMAKILHKYFIGSYIINVCSCLRASLLFFFIFLIIIYYNSYHYFFRLLQLLQKSPDKQCRHRLENFSFE